MPTTRLKFECKSHMTGDYGHQICLEPVLEGSEENKSFWEWTPCGKLDFSTTNAQAAAMFEVGKEYYIDIYPASEQSE